MLTHNDIDEDGNDGDDYDDNNNDGVDAESDNGNVIVSRDSNLRETKLGTMKSLVKTKLFNKRISNRIHTTKNRKYIPKSMSSYRDDGNDDDDDDVLEEVQLV
ncbi:unnamed protein product [Trichobilharzia szidati]|nr:unnamed protein product [Trichobilharzia szidati]